MEGAEAVGRLANCANLVHMGESEVGRLHDERPRNESRGCKEAFHDAPRSLPAGHADSTPRGTSPYRPGVSPVPGALPMAGRFASPFAPVSACPE